MKRTARSVVSFYVIAGTWLLVIGASLAVLHDPLGDITASAGVSLGLSWMLTLTIAIAAGAAAAGVVWHLLRRPAVLSDTTEREPVAARRDHPETTLATIR